MRGTLLGLAAVICLALLSYNLAMWIRRSSPAAPYTVQMFMDGSYFCCTHEGRNLRCRGVYIFNASNYIDTTKECQ